MDCNLKAVDQGWIEECERADYCAINETPRGTEYIVRIGDKIYVMIIPETRRDK